MVQSEFVSLNLSLGRLASKHPQTGIECVLQQTWVSQSWRISLSTRPGTITSQQDLARVSKKGPTLYRLSSLRSHRSWAVCRKRIWGFSMETLEFLATISSLLIKATVNFRLKERRLADRSLSQTRMGLYSHKLRNHHNGLLRLKRRWVCNRKWISNLRMLIRMIIKFTL